MTSVQTADRDTTARALTMRTVVDTWRGLTSAQIKATVAFGVAISLFHVIVWSYGMLQRPSLARPLIATFVVDQLCAFTLMLGIVVADRVTSGDRRAPYALAVVISAALLAALGPVSAEWFLASAPSDFSLREVLNSMVYSFFEWLVLGGAAAFIYTDRRRANAALARMRRAEIERARAAKRTLESRLQAMQARVEPQFLFNTLAQVKKLYAIDALLGERMLDELIAYLRAAMPKMRDTSSTLGQEIELARAYLAIVKLRLGDRLSYEIDSRPEAGDARMPPMMLLPLIDHAILHGLAEPTATVALRLRARIEDVNLRLDVTDLGGGFHPDAEGEALAGIRERLAALYGVGASLVLRSTESGATEAALQLPRAEALSETER